MADKIKTGMQKDIERSGKTSERIIGKTLEKSGSFIDKQTKNYSDFKQSSVDNHQTEEDIEHSLTNSNSQIAKTSVENNTITGTTNSQRNTEASNSISNAIKTITNTPSESQSSTSIGKTSVENNVDVVQTTSQQNGEQSNSVLSAIKTKTEQSSNFTDVSENKHRLTVNSQVGKTTKENSFMYVQNTSIQNDDNPKSVLNFIKTRVDSSMTAQDIFSVDDEEVHQSFKNSFFNKHVFKFHENQSNTSKALTIFGKTSSSLGKGMNRLSKTSTIINDSFNNQDGGFKFLEKQGLKTESKIAFKTGKVAGKKGTEFTKKQVNKMINHAPSFIKNSKFITKSKVLKQALSTVKGQLMSVIKNLAIQVIAPTISSAGVVVLVFIIIIALGSAGGGYSPIEGDPDFTNVEAWQMPNNPYAPTYYGQCTWFAWGRFYEIYGYSPGFLGNGNQCVYQLLETHPDKFQFSKTPIPGAVGSSDFNHNHVFIVVDVDGDNITVQDGNMNGVTDNWEVAITDWRKATFTVEQLTNYFGDCVYANPIAPKEDSSS